VREQVAAALYLSRNLVRTPDRIPTRVSASMEQTDIALLLVAIERDDVAVLATALVIKMDVAVFHHCTGAQDCWTVLHTEPSKTSCGSFRLSHCRPVLLRSPGHYVSTRCKLQVA
jgi:hypothetical protein